MDFLNFSEKLSFFGGFRGRSGAILRQVPAILRYITLFYAILLYKLRGAPPFERKREREGKAKAIQK